MALARDIKAKIDKKQVRTSWKQLDSCWAVLKCVTSNSVPVRHRRATTLRGAVKVSRSQISPRKAVSSAARCCEET